MMDMQLVPLFASTLFSLQIDEDTDEFGNLISEDYTRVFLPPLLKTRTGTLSEQIVEMKRMYKSRIQPVLKTSNCYRTYDTTKISSLKLIEYQIN